MKSKPASPCDEVAPALVQVPSTISIVDSEADQRFREMAARMSLAPDHLRVGGYAEYEWSHTRYALDNDMCRVQGKEILEFGCNVGATSIILAMLGAKVTAIDVEREYVALAEVNAARYGCRDKIRFLHVPDTRTMPFADRTFDLVSCNSVLEYVPVDFLGHVQREIDRVLKKGGLIAVVGTSNRLWPREVHTGNWCSNYLPRIFDSILPGQRLRRRGVWPWVLRFGFGDYDDLNYLDHDRTFLESKSRMGISQRKLRFLSLASSCLRPLGLSVGLILPSVTVILRKK